MKSKNSKRETLWVYYKYSTGTTRATLREYVDDNCTYVDDKATIDLAATIYKSWVDKNGTFDYPQLLVLPRGIYISDGSGSGFGQDAERDVSYHLVDAERARRIMFYNGDTWWQSLKTKIRTKWSWWCYKLRCLFDSRRMGAEASEDAPAALCGEDD